MKEIIIILSAIIGGSVLTLLLGAFFRTNSNGKNLIKDIEKNFKDYLNTTEKALKELEVKKDEIKNMSNDDLATDVNDKLCKRRNNME